MNKNVILLFKSILIIMLALTVLVACSSNTDPVDEETEPDSEDSGESEAAAGEPQEGGELVVGMTADPDTLNPLVSNTTPGNWINSSIYPHLMLMNEEGEKVPSLAESWETTNEGKTVTFKLREGVEWQDGTPITSEDIKFTGELLHEHQLQWTAAVFDQVESVETPDDLTVVYNLKRAYPGFAGTMGYWVRIVPKHIWEDVEDPSNFTNDDPVGAGPFKLVEWKKGQFVELETVDNWFAAEDGKPYLDKVTYRIYPDINTMVLALQKGDIDVTAQDIPTSALSQVESTEGLEVVQTPSLGYAYYSFNLNPDEPSPTEDTNFRLAMATATDREAIINVGLEGAAMDIDTPISSIYSEWINPDATAPEYNVEEAKSILEEAGYEDTDGDGTLNAPDEYGGENVNLEMIYDGANSFHQKVAKILEDNAKEIGVTLELSPVEYNTLSTRIFTEQDFEMHIGKWGAFDESTETMHTLLHSESALNFMGVNDPELDKIMEDAKYATSEDEAKENVFKAQEWFVNEFPVVPVYVQQFNLVYNSEKFGGFKVYPSDLQGLVDPNSLINVFQK
ncbi:ABC transporter substrate-binding protein [Virgibacillus byunsanensis]|uniref:ABC transporter substrate-binding protein n=1 Tax=Virgibacillus byunsanensis TaxID=570945 RepID=A0ABW3LJ84_9BACI